MIAQKSIQEVLAIARTDEIIEDYVSLKRRGVNMIGLCPFHNEKTPSFTVSPTKNIYKCFGCGKGGNAVQFLMDHESMTFVEAIRTLAERYGIELEETGNKEDYEEEKRMMDSLYLINDFAGTHFHNELLTTDEGKSVGLSYLKERGYLLATIQKYQLGYASSDPYRLTKLTKDKLFKEENVMSLGLTSKSGKDFFRERVIFPVFNLSGKIVGFGGRIMSSNTKAPKYLNSPESEIYNKRNLLYGIYQARKSIKAEDNCYLVEGYTDVISLSQSGVENVVASSGTALTENQVRLVKRYTDNITILFDGDPAGVKAALRGLDIVLEQMMNVKIVLLPEGQDPDSFIKEKGNAAFNEYMTEHAKDFIFFKMSLISEEAGNDPIKKSQLIRDIIQTLAKIPDTIKRSMYIQQCSVQLGVDETMLVKETNKAIRELIKRKRQERDAAEMRALREDNYVPPDGIILDHKQTPLDVSDEYQERDIARLVLTSGNKLYIVPDEEVDHPPLKVIQIIQETLADDIKHFKNATYKTIVTEAIDQYKTNGEVNSEFFIQHNDSSLAQTAIDLLSSPYTFANWNKIGIFLQTSKMPDENQQRDTDQTLLRYKLKIIDVQIEELKTSLADADPNSESYLIMLKILKELIAQRNIIAKELNMVVMK